MPRRGLTRVASRPLPSLKPLLGNFREMSSSCTEQRQALLECLADSDCLNVEGKSIKVCLEQVGVCKEVRNALFLCKRGQLDMRKRIKGNMPDDNPKEDE